MRRGYKMIAKFQYMFFKGRVLKGVCLGTIKESELKKDKEYYSIKTIMKKQKTIYITKVWTLLLFMKI